MDTAEHLPSTMVIRPKRAKILLSQSREILQTFAMVRASLRSKRFRLVSEQKELLEGDFRF